MGLYDSDRQQRWDQMIGGFRTLMAVGTLTLFIALALPVLLNQLPPVALLLAAWSSVGWLLTWLFRSPPKGWQPLAEYGPMERNVARMRKVSLIHLALFGSVDAILLLLVLAKVVRL